MHRAAVPQEQGARTPADRHALKGIPERELLFIELVPATICTRSSPGLLAFWQQSDLRTGISCWFASSHYVSMHAAHHLALRHALRACAVAEPDR